MAATQTSSNVQLRQTGVPAARGLESDADIAKRILVVAALAIPLFVAFWVGVVALAVTFTSVAYEAPLAMAAGVGVLAGIFWASWYGFVTFAHREEAERRAQRAGA
jgi:membrane protein implicated in regulation of membrane protease activity